MCGTSGSIANGKVCPDWLKKDFRFDTRLLYLYTALGLLFVVYGKISSNSSQCFSGLLDGPVLVISPLNIIQDDQLHKLYNNNIKSCRLDMQCNLITINENVSVKKAAKSGQHGAKTLS